LQVNGEEAFARRLSEIGFIRGEKIHNHMKAPLMDPVEYEIMGTTVSLRRSETKFIEISKEPVEKDSCPAGLKAIVEEEANTIDIVEGKENENKCNCQCSCSCNCNCNCNSNQDYDCNCSSSSSNNKENCQQSQSNENNDNDNGNENKSKNKNKNDDSSYEIQIEGVSEDEIEIATPTFCKFCPEQDECEKRKE